MKEYRIYLFRQRNAIGAATHISRTPGPFEGFEPIGTGMVAYGHAGDAYIADSNVPYVRPITNLDKQKEAA